MRTWQRRLGVVLALLDPEEAPRDILNRLWIEIATWDSISGLYVQCQPGHLQPSGTYLAGKPPERAAEMAAKAGPVTGPVFSGNLTAVARQLRDGNVPIAALLVGHHQGGEDAAAFLVDALSRYCLDRLRMQLQFSELREENGILRNSLSPDVRDHDIVSVSGAMHALIQSAARAAASNATVLIQGETGTGKELLARLIHSRSARARTPLITVNAGAFNPALLASELFGHVRGAFTGADQDRKGVFEVANGGTLFLDEVGELGMPAQVCLLRALQERTISRVGDNAEIGVDVRIIAATNRDLTADIAGGRFRDDLFYRLNVISLSVPPLRSRPEDIPPLVNHFLQRFNHQNFKQVEEVPAGVLDLLRRYSWPGNVRELENCVQKAVVLAPGKVFLEDLVPPTIRGCAAAPEPDPAAVTLQKALETHAERFGANLENCRREIERVLIALSLKRERGVKLRAARALGINRMTLDRKLSEYGIAVKRGQGIVETR